MHFKTSENDTMRNPHLDHGHHKALVGRLFSHAVG